MRICNTLFQATALGGAVLVSACGGSGTGFDGNSGFATSTNGVLSASLDSVHNTNTMSAGGGFLTYTSGFDSDIGYVAYAGIDSNISMGTVPTSGTATFSGTIGWNGTDLISTSAGNIVSGRPYAGSDSISLAADFANGTLTGTADNAAVSVNGSMSGSDLGGSVTYFGLTGSLDGVIGQNGAAGVFHGNGNTASNGNEVFSGGFVVTATTP